MSHVFGAFGTKITAANRGPKLNTVEQLAHDVLYINPALTEVTAQTLLELPGTPA